MTAPPPSPPVDIPLPARILTRIRQVKVDADEIMRGTGGLAAAPLATLYAQALDEIGGWCLDANGEAQVHPDS